jgi:hypothetical protein
MDTPTIIIFIVGMLCMGGCTVIGYRIGYHRSKRESNRSQISPDMLRAVKHSKHYP